jgi:hypothetical protein
MSTKPDAALNQLAEFLRQHPGSSVSKIARSLGWEWEKIQTTLGALRRRGRLVRSGNGYYVKPATGRDRQLNT